MTIGNCKNSNHLHSDHVVLLFVDTLPQFRSDIRESHLSRVGLAAAEDIEHELLMMLQVGLRENVVEVFQ